MTFVNQLTGRVETEIEMHYRHEISWMESSLAKGIFKWVVRSISPVYDIRKLYRKIEMLANKATPISHALEFKRIFTLNAKEDIFQYHSELVQQIKLVKMQGESMGLETVVPPWMEQSVLLIAAWQHEDYKKIAMEFTMEGKAFTVDALIRELRKQQLLKAHLNGAEASGKASQSADPVVRVKAAKETSSKPCYAFQRGECQRKDCPFSHEKQPGAKATGKGDKPNAPRVPKEALPLAGTCGNCGERHSRDDCKFAGTCAWCKKKGHKEALCRGKQHGKTKANMSVDECVEVRLCVATYIETELQAAPAPKRVASEAHVLQRVASEAHVQLTADKAKADAVDVDEP